MHFYIVDISNFKIHKEYTKVLGEQEVESSYHRWTVRRRGWEGAGGGAAAGGGGCEGREKGRA